MAVIRLAIANLKQTRMRAALTIGAVAAAVSLVVAMTSAFSSLHAVAYQLLDDFYSAVDVVIEPAAADNVMRIELAQAIEQDERVEDVRTLLQIPSLLVDETGDRLAAWPVRLRGLDDPAAHEVGRRELAEGRWFAAGEQRPVAVIGHTVARRMDLEVGSTVGLPVPEADPLKVEVVGVVTQPEALWMEPPALHLPLAVLQDWASRGETVSRIEVNLHPGEDLEAFIADWEERTDLARTPMEFRTEMRHKQTFDSGIIGVRVLSYVGGAIAMLAAAFIIFSTLSMGVAERSRLLGMLRAIGAVKRQVAGLVVAEGMALAAVGAGVGVLLGWLWIALLAGRYGDLFVAGAVLSGGGVAFAVGGALLAALLASLLPAVTATRIDPLQAITAVGRPARRGATALCAVAGAGLIGVDHLILLTPDLTQNARLWLHLTLGMPALLLGLFLITPALIRLAEPLLAPLVARLLAVRTSLLRQQLSGGLWRTAGTVAALSVGLAALVAIQVHGRSLIGGWQLPDEFPDMVLFSPLGVDADAIDRIAEVDGIRADHVLPVALVSPELGTEVVALFGMMQRPDATMMFGLDVDRALGSDQPPREPMVGVVFLEGDPAAAREALKRDRAVVITEEFHNFHGHRVGDTLTIDTPRSGDVDYTVVGITRSLGADRIARLFDIEREMQSWTVGAMLTSIENVRQDFGLPRLHLFMVNLDTGADKEAITREVRAAVGERLGLLAADTRSLKEGIDEALLRLLNLLSAVALAALAVASLGVLNTILASVRARRWQLGVLRSIGLTRGAMVRLVLAEAVLIGLLASVLGLTAGLLIAHLGNLMTHHLAGYHPPLLVPPAPLMVGVAITLAVTLLASAVPAALLGRAETLSLLQAGRTSG